MSGPKEPGEEPQSPGADGSGPTDTWDDDPQRTPGGSTPGEVPREQLPEFYFKLLDLWRRESSEMGQLPPDAGLQPALTDDEEVQRRKASAEIGLKDQDVELRKQEVELRKQEVALREQEVALRKQEIEQRAPYAKWAGIGMAGQLAIADVVFVGYGFAVGWRIPNPVISAWLAATVVEVIAVVLIITRNLFPNRDAAIAEVMPRDGSRTDG